jgi:preprotein translocase subunit YajC
MNFVKDTYLVLAQSGAPEQPSLMWQMMPFVLLMVGFWFLLIQPQRKKQKALEKLISELKVGDHVITSGGICGTVTLLKKDRLQLKVDDNTRIEVIRSAVQGLDSREK